MPKKRNGRKPAEKKQVFQKAVQTAMSLLPQQPSPRELRQTIIDQCGVDKRFADAAIDTAREQFHGPTQIRF